MAVVGNPNGKVREGEAKAGQPPNQDTVTKQQSMANFDSGMEDNKRTTCPGCEVAETISEGNGWKGGGTSSSIVKL